MGKFHGFAFPAILSCTLFTALCCSPLHSQSRIAHEISLEARTNVEGSSPHQLLTKSIETGRVSPNQNLGRMVLLLAPTKEQEAAAKKLVAAQHDAASPSFHHWLTPAEFGQQFGIADADAAEVKSWLESQGLTVHSVAQSRRFVVFSGNVAQVEHAFDTEMHSYTYSGQPYISNSSDIQIPSVLRSVVQGVVRLHSDPAKPQLVLGKKVPFQKKPGQFTFGDGSHYLTPADFAKIYNVQPLYDAGIDGTGQTIAIVGRSNIDIQNVRDFRTVLGLAANDPQIIVNGDDPGQTGDATEAMLDVTWSGAVAPGAQIKFVVSQSNFADGVDVSAAYIVDNNLAPVMSTSYGQCELSLGPIENAFFNSLWLQAAAQGITSFVSAGDNGGAGCDAPGAGYYSSGNLAVNGIASTPYNVAVGGTQFDDTTNPDTYWSTSTDPVTGASALSYIPERIWNESSNDPNDVSLYAGSGGVSSLYPKPDWQIATGVPNDGARDLPDISLTAAGHDGYLFCFESSCSYGDYFYSAGGTSISSPSSAGIMALVNQKMGGQPQGMANYVFYRLSSVPGIFHDTTVGDNKVPDPSGLSTVGYDAVAGYDLASGLGSFDANALVNHWQTAATGKDSGISLALAAGQSSTAVHGSPIAFNAKVSCTGTCTTPVGNIALSAASATAPTLGAGTGTLNSLGAATISTASIPGGKYNVSARYGGDGTYGPSTSGSVPVTVTPESSQTFVGAIGGGSFTTAPITLEYGLAWQIAIAVAGNSGHGYPSGQLTLTADGQPFSTSSYDAGTGNLNPNSLILNYGEKSSLLTNAPSSQASTISYVAPTQVLGAGKHVFVATYPGDASFGASSGNYSYNVLQATSAIEDFFPVGTQVANVPVALAGQVGFVNYGYAPYSGTMTISDVTGATPVVLGSGPLDPTYGGSYSVNVTVPTAGTHQIRVDFSGDVNVKPSYQTYTVPFPANAPSYTSLTADVSNAIAGQPITLTANVSSDVRLYTATGAVSFFNGSTAIGTANLDNDGNAVLVITSLPAGTDNLTASYPGDAILQSSVSSPTTDTVADFVLQLLPATLTIAEGQTASTSINLVPLGGFAQPITLSCGNLPANTTCTFASPTVTLDGLHPGTVSLQINTAGAVAHSVTKGKPWALPTSIALAGLLLLPFTRCRRWRNFLASLVLLACTLSVIGCSGPSHQGQTPAGSYSIQITATGATGTTPKKISLAVNVTK
jgi:Pro-kumamolisin, activation domain/Bacterial Ig-like domain (group 3)